MAGSECHMPPGSVHGAGLSGGEESSRSCQGPGDNKETVSGSRKECRKYRAESVHCYFPWGLPVPFWCGQHWDSPGMSGLRGPSLGGGGPGSSPIPSLTIGFEFFEASAKDNINVKQTFERLVDVICEKMSESLDTADPAVTGAKQGPQLTDQQAPPHQDCAC